MIKQAALEAQAKADKGIPVLVVAPAGCFWLNPSKAAVDAVLARLTA